MSAESSLVGELERRVGDQEEAVRCLMELVEDTLPTEHVQAALATLTERLEEQQTEHAEQVRKVEAAVREMEGRLEAAVGGIEEGAAGWRSTVSAVETQCEPLASRVEMLEQSWQEASSVQSERVRKVEVSAHDIDRRLEAASGNIADIKIRLLGKVPNDSTIGTQLSESAVEERLRAVEVSVERAVVVAQRQVEATCRKELALARAQWEHGAEKQDVQASALRDADRVRLEQRIDELVLQHEALAQQALTHNDQLASLQDSSMTTTTKTQALATRLATISAQKSELSSVRDDIGKLERYAVLREPTTPHAAAQLSQMRFAFRRLLTVAEEAGNGALNARHFCTEECNRLATTSLRSTNDLVDSRLKSYSTLEELDGVRQLVQASARLTATGRPTLEFTDRSKGEAVDMSPALSRSAMREEVRRYAAELQSHAAGLREELRESVQRCSYDVGKLQSQLDDAVREFRSTDTSLNSHISGLERRLESTVDPLIAKVSTFSEAQRNVREELRERTAAQLDALRQHLDSRLQAHESDMLRSSREMSTKLEEHRHSCDNAVHEVGTHGEIARGQIRQDLRAEIEALRANQLEHLDATVSQAKINFRDSIDTLRESWIQRDSEMVVVLRELQESVEARLLELAAQTDGKMADLRTERDEMLASTHS